MTTQQSYNDFLLRLQRIYDAREAGHITNWVFENITGLQRWQIKNDTNILLKDEDANHLNTCLAELLLHKPVQYILHEAWFYKMKFYVNEHVLVPRPETEELVSWIIEDIKKVKRERGPCIFDIGTGSGCIAIALKKNIGGASVIAVDVSNDAVVVAKKNAQALGAEITFHATDFLLGKNTFLSDGYDVIVSNPPYIPVAEKDKLDKNVAGYEPYQALFVSDDDPFVFYKKIAVFAQSNLKDNGSIYVEMHEDYAKETAFIFNEYLFTTIIKKDMYGKERMLKAYK